jgi:ketosteroid isomerase-like protein
VVQSTYAAVEIPVHYRHRETGVELVTTIANFWTFEDGWPIKLSEYHDVSRIQEFKEHLAANGLTEL